MSSWSLANIVSQMIANSVSLSARARQIVEAARQLLEEEGLDGLTMRRLSEGFEEVAKAFEQAAAGDDDPLEAIAHAYRDYARAHPHLYRLMTERPLDREALTPGVEDRAALPVYLAVGEDPALARAAWAFAHGMTNLELNERFPPDADLDAAWRCGLAAFRAARSSAS